MIHTIQRKLTSVGTKAMLKKSQYSNEAICTVFSLRILSRRATFAPFTIIAIQSNVA